MDIWIKLEGVLSEPSDPPSNWAIGAKTAVADEVMKFAREMTGDPNKVYVYADAAESLRGHRAVQRWLIANDLYAWVAFQQEPPPRSDTVEVIDQWPMNSQSNSSPADREPKTSLPSLDATTT